MILSIETATSVCSVALFDPEKNTLVSYFELQIERAHSNKLTSLIEQALQLSNVSTKQLSALAISEGPGSYTGLRIGTAVAKGLCFTLGIPLIAVNTLKAIAHSFVENQKLLPQNTLLAPMIDARRMEVYTTLFDTQLNEVQAISAMVIEENSFTTFLNKQTVIFMGDGAAKTQDLLTHSNAHFSNPIFPNAKSIGYLALEKFHRKIFEDVAYFEPFYLKDFLVKKSTKKLL